jgi:hypothetical protein
LGSSFATSLVLDCTRAGSLDLVAAAGRMTPLIPSGLVFTLVERLNPVRRVDALAVASSGCMVVSPEPCTRVFEGMCIDLGLSAVVLGLAVLLRASGTVLVDCVRE